ncbi:MAG: methionine adenosyltransferase [Holophagales bacterium]|nr:methionine adenosyltransferase [Holophagales bacterium]MYD22474.1 methionine adenosyltransferase [Holophagales bacterium]MYI34062.1 methionine adenosyltransferase [Holophagales bacterium]
MPRPPSGTRRLFTSESVTEGHPDKVADQISDAVLDAALSRDPEARVACETLVNTGLVLIAGEIKLKAGAEIDYAAVARRTIRDIGYIDTSYGFAADDCAVLCALDPQSEDIALGVNPGGAGDQGLMFGYACRETDEYMPLPIELAHRLTRRLAELRRSGDFDWLRPDGKSQVTVEYGEGGEALRVHTVVVSTQHARGVGQEEIRRVVREHVVRPSMPGDLFDNDTILHVNPTGQFVIGGPQGDCGLTGRKIIVDTYGGVGHHGGGAFSGKDPTKVDRSASYMARYVAKNLVAAGMADRLEVQLAYAIGVARPVSVYVDSFRTAREGLSDRLLEEIVVSEFALEPLAIIDELHLRQPRYLQTAAYGHFGRSEFPWERVDRAPTLRRAVA